MLDEPILFEIPVYRSAPVQLLRKYRKKFEDALADHDRAMRAWPDSPATLSQEETATFDGNWHNMNRPPYPYNDVMAFVRIELWGTQLHARLFKREGMKMMPSPRGSFYDCGVIDKLEFMPLKWSELPCNDEIRKNVHAWLSALTEDTSLKGRSLDLSAYQNVAAFLNWSNLLKEA